MRSAPISPLLFSRNRSKLSARLPGGAMALLCSNPRMPRSADQHYPYRQHPDFFYLTGISREGCMVAVHAGREALFIPRPDPRDELWNGPVLSSEEASRLSGIADIRWTDELEPYLERYLDGEGALMLNHEESGKPPGTFRSPDALLYARIKKRFPGYRHISLIPLMRELRMVKEPQEIEQIRMACAITRSAFFRAAGKVKPGVREYRIEAELISEFIAQGAMGHAFEPIVASGENALVLHYVRNNSICRDGELLLMDFGAEVNHYSADCTRVLPVGGSFTPRQREIYEAVWRVMEKARGMMVPGQRMAEFHRSVGNLMEQEHLSLGIYTREEAEARPEEDPLWRKYFMHGTSHSLGLDVHDPFNREVPFQPGMVLTLEPAIYIPEEGIGIRLEDDILITPEGPEDLMADIPLDPGEIEKLTSS